MSDHWPSDDEICESLGAQLDKARECLKRVLEAIRGLDDELEADVLKTLDEIE